MRANNLAKMATVLAMCCAAGCSSPSPTITGPSTERPASGTVAVFIQANTPPGAFTLTLAGQTMTTAGPQRFDVPDGTHIVTGRARSEASGMLAFRISGLEGMDVGRLGGPEKGTLQSLDGAVLGLSECQIQYRASAEIEFRFQFNASRAVPIDRRC